MMPESISYNTCILKCLIALQRNTLWFKKEKFFESMYGVNTNSFYKYWINWL